MSEENAVFSFELNESLYFERGQEVAEILGISLDPEISIQPYNDYISIRGVIELKGEYQRINDYHREESSFNLDDYSSRRYVEQVRENDTGEAVFSHRFPVEISVPTYRVKDMNDVTVSVEYFDYEIPDQSQLRLTSIIAIQGISDIVENTEETNEEETIDLKETFRFDIKEKYNEEVQEPDYSHRYSEKSYVQAYEEPENDEIILQEELENTQPSSYQTTDRSKSDEDNSEKVDYLSNMFRKDEERYSKMKLCIVQDNDTIETIAERYKVSPLHITKKNNLEDETVTEGQLLYIPVKQ
ncbi:LysM peptidoglycan-binding domain-containing protein [Virgibacillus flavescens]|uniref:LysM peptidoglycan-binding domain-containing protein n=1 Tax=Virgibacillus flavescens TaxID=1611422 RepID=UPI003D351F56